MSEMTREFRVVLCRPKFSANVGAVCRAMKTMGITSLAIVGGQGEDRRAALATAVHAADIYESALRVNELPDAVADCVLVGGATRRRGRERKRAVMLPEDFARMAERASGTVAVVFGNEETGLTSEELAHCSAAITIPSDPAFPSLNLSHAVQILTYVLYRHEWTRPTYSPVPVSRVSAAIGSIMDDLDAVGGLSQSDHEATRSLLHDLIGRATATETEIRQLEGLFQRIRHRREGAGE